MLGGDAMKIVMALMFMAFTIGLSLGSMQSDDEVARLRKQVDDSIHTAEEALKVQQRWEKIAVEAQNSHDGCLKLVKRSQDLTAKLLRRP